jgi:pyruvate dehydrogenase E2 component (dihydrolipoamide acetyltransferase)
MATPIQMPALSPTMKEGKITRWLKKVGDKVSSGEAIAEVETDKSNLEIEAYDDGVLLQIAVGEGEQAQVGAPIAWVGEKGEKVQATPAKQKTAPAPAPAKTSAGAAGKAAVAVQMPALSPTMKEGKITRWLKQEGEKVSSGDALAEVETDKSNLQIEAYDDGTLLRIAVKEGDSAPVGAPIAFIGEQGDRIQSPGEPPAEQRPASPPVRAKPPAAAPAQAGAPPSTAHAGRRLRISPLARKMAKERGLDPAQLHGSGPQGRIVKRDVEQAPAQAARPRAAAAATRGTQQAPTRVEISGMRRVIAQRMGEVKPGVPHFYLSVDIEMDQALAVREEARALESKVSVNDIIVKAAGLALRRVPKMNVTFAGDHVLQHHGADVGIAVAIEDGLITPVIRDADQKGLGQISAESRDLAERGRSRKLKPDEYTGGSITLSNLGMFGIDSFIAVINPPQAAIVAVGAVSDKVVVRGGQIVVRKMMSATLSGDHRVIDGALGAVYLKELKGLLEHPLRLLF